MSTKETRKKERKKERNPTWSGARKTDSQWSWSIQPQDKIGKTQGISKRCCALQNNLDGNRDIESI